MRTVALAAMGFGVTVGLVEVAVPAAATKAGTPSVGGLLLALFSISSVLFGVFYAAHPWPRSLALRLPALMGAFSVLIAVLAIPSSLIGLGAALLLAGTMITPQSTATSATIEVVAPPGTVTETFGRTEMLPESASAWAGPVTETRLIAPVARVTMVMRMQCLFTSIPHRVGPGCVSAR